MMGFIWLKEIVEFLLWLPRFPKLLREHPNLDVWERELREREKRREKEG